MVRFLAYVLMVASFGGTSAGTIAHGSLTGKMAMFNYVLGGQFDCHEYQPLLASVVQHINPSATRFEAESSNTLYWRTRWNSYTSDAYLSYDQNLRLYWLVVADSKGGAGWFTSRDGATFSGTGSNLKSERFAASMTIKPSIQKTAFYMNTNPSVGSGFRADTACSRHIWLHRSG